MDKLSLIKKIEEQIKIFNKRASFGTGDGKRHDKIDNDEQEYMWLASTKLKWTNAKIGSEFKRDQRTVKGKIEHFKPQSKKIVRDPIYIKHYDDLAEVAKTLYDVQKCLQGYAESEKYTIGESYPNSGMWCFSPLPKNLPDLPTFVGACAPVESPEAQYLFFHLFKELSGSGLKDWKELMTTKLGEDVVERLRYLGNTGKFEFCLSCQKCKDLKA